jgi:hypothetical protein
MNNQFSEHWDVMNKLEEAFSNINSISFMMEQLQEAVDSNNYDKMVDVSLALNAFLPVYTDNWDRKFKEAWDQVVKENNK